MAAGSALSALDDVHPVQRVQVVEVDHVVLHVLDAFDQVADDPRVGRNLDSQSILYASHGGDGMYRRADAADALGEDPGVARVAPFQDHLDAAEHRATSSRHR